MFAVELRFKIAVREVTLERFAEVLLGKAFETLRQEIRQVQVPVVRSQPMQRQEARPMPRGRDQ